MEFAKYFVYDETSPSKLTRIAGYYTGNHCKGDLGHCGYISPDTPKRSRWRVKHCNKSVFVHRIVWELFYGEVPEGLVVDHINGNPLDNTIGNLRIVTQKRNCQNKNMHSDNSSGVNGVCFSPKENRYRTFWNDLNGNKHSKSFSVNKYGEAEAFRLACEHRREVILELNTEGAGYTERHGT